MPDPSAAPGSASSADPGPGAGAGYSPTRSSGRYDAVIVGGGHNSLTAAAYLARAGLSVLVLESADHVGGAAVSAQVFEGVGANLSRYAYLVSLLPARIRTELGLQLQLVRRRYASYTPVPADPSTGLLVDHGDSAATAASFARVTGGQVTWQRWGELYGRLGRAAERIFPTLLEPLRSVEELRSLVEDEEIWRLLTGEPLGTGIGRWLSDDVVSGVALTDGLIGTFTSVEDAGLAANRCFLYHVIGGGTGDWDVPVGGMGTVTAALAGAARRHSADIRTRCTVTSIDPGDAGTLAEVSFVDADGVEHRVGGARVLAGCAPTTLERLLGQEPVDEVEGAQVKVNLVLTRLPRLHGDIDPVAAFSGTFHINETATQLETAYRQAAEGRIPDLPPCEIYCHSLTDPSILSPELRASGAQTLTMFALHLPTRLFRQDNDAARELALQRCLASLNSVLAEPIEDCLLVDAQGRACVEAATPVDIETSVGLPGGNIFARPLQWPFAEEPDDQGRWGVETRYPRVLLAGAGARRGGGVSGIPGRNAAMAVLGE
ncbi:MAG: phytoene desaturase family protein [Actinomycetales bacterium]